MRDHLELGLVDGGVPMRRPINETVLCIVNSGSAMDVDR